MGKGKITKFLHIGPEEGYKRMAAWDRCSEQQPKCVLTPEGLIRKWAWLESFSGEGPRGGLSDGQRSWTLGYDEKGRCPVVNGHRIMSEKGYEVAPT